MTNEQFEALVHELEGRARSSPAAYKGRVMLHARPGSLPSA